MRQAEDAGMDLVLVAEGSVPPVCRIMDFKKKQYEAKRAQREAKKKQVIQKVKEVKFHATIDTNDYGIKVKQIQSFLEKSHKVRVSLFLRGRELGFKDKAMELMESIITTIGDLCVVEDTPKMVKRSIGMVLGPSPKKKK